MPDEITADADLLNAAVAEASELALKYFNNGTKSWEKSPGNPVSNADLAVDTLLKDRLITGRPDYGWLSEETPDTSDRLGRDRVWMVDPIDGTRAFLKGRPEFTVCAGLVEQGRPVLGAVCNPAAEEFFEARVGTGARLNGAKLLARDGTELTTAKLLASPRTFAPGGAGPALPSAEFSAVNSIAYRMVLIAAGRFNATISMAPKSDWDIAAADIICREAGCFVTDQWGSEFSYNARDIRHPGVVVAPPALHREIISGLAAA
jgi:myo-inositol-1(or 4)-monophosphatase